MTQKQIAEYLRGYQSNYSKVERGLAELSLEDAIKLAQLYETSVDYLVGLTDVKDPYPKSRRK